MKKHLAIITTTLSIFCIFNSMNLQAENENRPHPKPCKQFGGPNKGGPRRGEMFKKFDKDNDGKLDETEKAAAKAAMEHRMLEKFDANKNGVLDPAEKEAAMKERQKEGKGNKEDSDE